MVNSGWPRTWVAHYGKTGLTRQQKTASCRAKAILHDNWICDEGTTEVQAPSMATHRAVRWPYPAWDHRTASSTTESATVTTDRPTPLNTLRFHSFHRHQDPRIVRESKPLRRADPSIRQRDSHQSRKLIPGCGVRRSRPMGASTLCQTSLAKMHSPARCCTVSCSWSQKAQASLSCSRRRFLLA
jgi:hypothetical protein